MRNYDDNNSKVIAGQDKPCTLSDMASPEDDDDSVFNSGQ